MMDHASAKLADLLAAIGPDTFSRVRSRLASEHTRDLLVMYRAALDSGKRQLAFVLADALTARSVPPCFRKAGHLATADNPSSGRYDLLMHDLQWIRAMYPEQRDKAQGGHSGMLAGDSWVAIAEHYLSTKNYGETWLIVRQLALTIDQQWECAILRSAPIKRAASGLDTRKRTVEQAIMNRLREAKRTHRGNYPLEPAYERRLKVWVCGEMTGGSPTKAARLYGMWTGTELARNVAHADLDWVHARIPESRKRRRAEGDKRDMQ